MCVRQFLSSLVLLPVLACVPLLAAAEPRYTVAVALPGMPFPTAMNNAGWIVGATGADWADHPYAMLYADGELRPLSTGESLAFDINNAGEVSAAGRGTDVIFLENVIIGQVKINDRGQGINGPGTSNVGYLYSNGTRTDIGSLGDRFTRAMGINNLGQVVGASTVHSFPPEFHAFLYSEGVMTDLGTLGGVSSYAYAINDRGQVVGSAGINDGRSGHKHHAFLYSDGVMTDLGELYEPVYAGSSASDVNNLGQVVGMSNITPFLYTDGVMLDLNLLIDPADGWNLTAAIAINDSAQILARGCNADGCFGVRLDPICPVPEPESWTMLLAGVLLLGGTLAIRNARAHNR